MADDDPGPALVEDRLSRWRRTRLNATPQVLVVDDEEDFLELSADILSDAGFSVIKAKSAEEAMQLVQEAAPDIAVLDLYIPGGDGFQILKALRAQPATRDIPVFATTGADIREVDTLLKVGFDGHFPKPVNWPGLSALLHKLFGQA